VIILRDIEEGMLINVLVKPGSKQSDIRFDPDTTEFNVQLKSSPIKGKANRELLQSLKDYFKKLGYRSVGCTIIRGHTSRNKIIFVENIKTEGFREKILAYDRIL